MITIAKAGHNTSLVAAFQAAVRIEGEDGQRVWIAFSKEDADSDKLTWWPPMKFPHQQPPEERNGTALTGAATAQWGPVLHLDEESRALWLFFSESNGECHRAPTEDVPVGRWTPGGDVMAAHFDGRKWSQPNVIYAKSAGSIPKVTANRLTVLESGWWVLPFWRQRPRPVDHVYTDSREDPLTGLEVKVNVTEQWCLTPPNKRNSAGVLISEDRGATWWAYGALESHEASWLIENTVAETSPGRLLMLFRTRAGVAFGATSDTGGKTWEPARAELGVPYVEGPGRGTQGPGLRA
mmetsp:Transcript_58342/g.185950  ORF Transcript_58342/g.185950 Transcript_58342/m.185950 type:complete len:295 (+) Transcript_58342:605-1489(+)